MSRETVVYDGFTWNRYPDARRRSDRVYYKRTVKKDGKYYPQTLHRYIYEKAHGEIPKGFHVHHKDGNPNNNALENLECLSAAEHVHKHPYTAERLEEQKIHLDRVRPLTKTWHKSAEGRAKHKEIGALSYKNFKPEPKACAYCGKVFLPHAVGNRDKFCSNACKSAWRRQQHIDDEERTCPVCGKSFFVNKYSDKKTCSRSCANRLRAKEARDGLRLSYHRAK